MCNQNEKQTLLLIQNLCSLWRNKSFKFHNFKFCTNSFRICSIWTQSEDLINRFCQVETFNIHKWVFNQCKFLKWTQAWYNMYYMNSTFGHFVVWFLTRDKTSVAIWRNLNEIYFVYNLIVELHLHSKIVGCETIVASVRLKKLTRGEKSLIISSSKSDSLLPNFHSTSSSSTPSFSSLSFRPSSLHFFPTFIIRVI